MAEIQRKKLIILNGPPGSGKTTGALAICGYISKHAAYMQPRHFQIAEPLKKGAHALVEAFDSWDHFDKPLNASLKDRPSGDYLGLTPRELYIKLGTFMTTVFGDEVQGMIMRKRLHRAQGCMVGVISDGGFVPEVNNLIEYATPENVLIIELHSIGCTFDNDSRNYIGDELKQLHPEITVRRIHNEKGDQADLELFRIYCMGAAKGFLKIEEKQE